jgi:NAD+ kinase
MILRHLILFLLVVIAQKCPFPVDALLLPFCRTSLKSSVGSRSYLQTRHHSETSEPSSLYSEESSALNGKEEEEVVIDLSPVRKSDAPSTEAFLKPSASSSPPPTSSKRRRLDLMWCQEDYCKDAVRERVVGMHNQIYLNGPATGQVAYHWTDERTTPMKSPQDSNAAPPKCPAPPTVLLLIRPGDDTLLEKAADAVKKLTADPDSNVRILLDPSTAARLKHYHGVDDHIRLFEVEPTPGYGSNLGGGGSEALHRTTKSQLHKLVPNTDYMPDLICTLGGDGLLMHASMIFQGPVPPILCVSGGSLGFLTPFRPDEMVDAIKVALGLGSLDEECKVVSSDSNNGKTASTPTIFRDIGDHVYPPNMPSYPYEPLLKAANECADDDSELPRFSFGRGGRICLSIRMRLECTVISREGSVRARYNVLNEVVIDRGSSPYLAALECFCDDVHLTTVQADGVIFATPTGSTAYSLAAGSSVVHPAVPCILVTPICPHVLSFRSMVFPDHVVLRCYVPDDARAVASVAFDGKHRQELSRGDSVQVRMSCYPVPTINRDDHSSDWLGSLKRNFNFNSRARQQPL